MKKFQIILERISPAKKKQCMKDYAQVTTRENPGHKMILMIFQPEDIMELALKLKTNSCDVSVSYIVSRGDHWRKKASVVNHRLKDLCKENACTTQIIAIPSA